MSVCPEWDSQEIFGRKVDEPPTQAWLQLPACTLQDKQAESTRVGAFANEVDRHEEVPGLAAKPGIDFFVPGSRRQGHAIHPKVKSTPFVLILPDLNLLACNRHKDVTRRDLYARGTVYKLYSYVRVKPGA